VLVIAASQPPFEDVANSPRTMQGTSPAHMLIHPYSQSEERLNTVKALWIIRVAYEFPVRIHRYDLALHCCH
jgi:type II secretory pathway component PulK